MSPVKTIEEAATEATESLALGAIVSSVETATRRAATETANETALRVVFSPVYRTSLEIFEPHRLPS